jgi:hypothetical protein
LKLISIMIQKGLNCELRRAWSMLRQAAWLGSGQTNKFNMKSSCRCNAETAHTPSLPQSMDTANEGHLLHADGAHVEQFFFGVK